MAHVLGGVPGRQELRGERRVEGCVGRQQLLLHRRSQLVPQGAGVHQPASLLAVHILQDAVEGLETLLGTGTRARVAFI